MDNRIFSALITIFFVTNLSFAQDSVSIRTDNKGERIEIPWKNGKTNGLQKSYFKNGTLQREANFVDNKQTGIDRTYYENGKLKKEAIWSDNKLNGTLKEFDESGKLTRETLYVDGKPKKSTDNSEDN